MPFLRQETSNLKIHTVKRLDYQNQFDLFEVCFQTGKIGISSCPKGPEGPKGPSAVLSTSVRGAGERGGEQRGRHDQDSASLMGCRGTQP